MGEHSPDDSISYFEAEEDELTPDDKMLRFVDKNGLGNKRAVTYQTLILKSVFLRSRNWRQRTHIRPRGEPSQALSVHPTLLSSSRHFIEGLESCRNP